MSAPVSRGRNVLLRLFILGQLADDLLGRSMTGLRVLPNDFAVLSAIGALEPVMPSRLAALLGMPPTTLSSYLRRLEAARLVRRKPNPNDGRSSLLELTKSGKTRVRSAVPALQGSVARVHERLDYSPRELDLALDRLEDALRAVLATSAGPPGRARRRTAGRKARPGESGPRPGQRARRRGR
jgi:DNA-binding MarR family transcriptional regulator